MQDLQESTIDAEQLLAFAEALMNGDFSARLPATEEDTPADDAIRRLNHFAGFMQTMVSEITRLSNELNQGVFGGQTGMVVSMRRGPWRDCIEAFNNMAGHMTEQMRDFAKTTSRLAAGRTDHPATVDCQGEMLKFKNSLNALVEKMKPRA
jgi:methyl-accepting chemotaxis protein